MRPEVPVHICLSSSEVLYTGVADQIKTPPGRSTRFSSTRRMPPAQQCSSNQCPLSIEALGTSEKMMNSILATF